MLPQTVRRLTLRDCAFSFAEDAGEMVPAMAEGVEPCRRRGLVARWVDELALERVTMTGVDGERLEAREVALVKNDKTDAYIS